MMVTLCIFIGLGLFLCGIIITCSTNKGHDGKANNNPPPLPPRTNSSMPISMFNQYQNRTNDSYISPAMPPRHSSRLVNINANQMTDKTCYGPRGIKPSQFPCCPFDKQRNVPGERQVIFWDSGASRYRCSRGHQFKSNGKPL